MGRATCLPTPVWQDAGRDRRFMRNICKIEGCDGVCEGGGLCHKHYRRLKRYGDPNYVTKDASGIVKAHREEYNIYCGIKTRCYNPNVKCYPNYGGRGIKVCDEWLGVYGFRKFFEDMGPRPSKQHSIDRIDVDGDYSPENCRWATPKEQAENKRISKAEVRIDYLGENKNFKDWCLTFGVNYQTAYARYRDGWPLDKVFSPTKFK